MRARSRSLVPCSHCGPVLVACWPACSWQQQLLLCTLCACTLFPGSTWCRLASSHALVPPPPALSPPPGPPSPQGRGPLCARGGDLLAAALGPRLHREAPGPAPGDVHLRGAAARRGLRRRRAHAGRRRRRGGAPHGGARARVPRVPRGVPQGCAREQEGDGDRPRGPAGGVSAGDDGVPGEHDGRGEPAGLQDGAARREAERGAGPRGQPRQGAKKRKRGKKGGRGGGSSSGAAGAQWAAPERGDSAHRPLRWIAAALRCACASARL